MRLLITGASGFIGSRLVEVSLDRRYEVIGVSRGGCTRHMTSILHNKNFNFVQADLTDDNVTLDLLNRWRPDAVIHAAARVAHTVSDNDPLLFLKNNALATANVASSATKAGVKHLIFISSMHVYKTPPIYLPIDERHPVEPSSYYGISKLVAELYCRQFALDNKISVTVLRCSGVYGPGQQKTGAIPKFIDLSLRGKDIYLDSGGLQTSDFVWVDDVVNASLLSLQSDATAYRLFNIGSGVELSVKELVDMIRSLCSSNSKINVANTTSAYNYRFSLNINKANEQLNYAPCSPEKALKHCIQQWIEGKW